MAAATSSTSSSPDPSVSTKKYHSLMKARTFGDKGGRGSRFSCAASHCLVWTFCRASCVSRCKMHSSFGVTSGYMGRQVGQEDCAHVFCFVPVLMLSVHELFLLSGTGLALHVTSSSPQYICFQVVEREPRLPEAPRHASSAKQALLKHFSFDLVAA